MTVTRSDNYVIHQGDGQANIFPFEFRVPDPSYLVITVRDAVTKVVVAVLTPSQYSVTGANPDNTGGGSITYPLDGGVLPTGQELLIERIVPLTQELDLINQGGYYPENTEDGLDKMEMQIQQIGERSGRSLVVPMGEAGLTIPPIASRMGTILGFDDAGNPITTISYLSLINAAAAAVAAAAAAADSAAQAHAIVIGAQPVKTVSADYTISEADLGYLLRIDSPDGTNIYIPNYPILPVGFWCDVEQYGAGSVYLLADVDATVRSLNNYNKITGRYGIARIRVDTTASVVLSEDLLGTGSIGWLVNPPRIARDGYTVELDMISSRAGGVADPAGVPDCLTVVSEGYQLIAGVPTLTTISRTLSITSWLRKTYNVAGDYSPDIEVQGDTMTIVGVLSHNVYDDDKAGGAGTSGVNPILILPAGWWQDGPRSAPGQTNDCTNLSEEDYPLPNLQWNVPPRLNTGDWGGKVLGSVFGAGAKASLGNMGIAAIKFIFTGIGNSTASISPTVAASGHVENVVMNGTSYTVTTDYAFATSRTLPGMEWFTQVDHSGFTDREKIRKDFEAYPVLGDTPLRSADYVMGVTYNGAARPSTYFDICDKGTYGRAYVAVDRTSGDDGAVDGAGVYTPGANGGQVYTSRAAAIAGKAFLTCQRAGYVLQQYSGVNYGRTELGNHYVIAVGAGNFDIDMALLDAANPPRVNFTQEDMGAQDTWTYFDRSGSQLAVPNASNARKAGPLLTCNMIPMLSTGTGNLATIWDLKKQTGSTSYLWVRNQDHTGLSNASIGMIRGMNFYFITGAKFTNPGSLLRAQGTDNACLVLLRDTDVINNVVTGAPLMANGVTVQGCTQPPFGIPNAAGNAPASDGRVMANVAVMASNGAVAAISFSNVGFYGSALINVLVEGVASSSNSYIQLNNDGNLNATKNNYWYFVGLMAEGLGRLNHNYEDATPLGPTTYNRQQLKKAYFPLGCFFINQNCKTDLFVNPTYGPDANRHHNWNVAFHVNAEYNCMGIGDAQWVFAPGPGHHVGEVFGVGEFVLNYPRVTVPSNPTQVEAAYAYVRAQFTNWKASPSLGGGVIADYVPAPGSEIVSALPASRRPCKFDMRGGVRGTSGFIAYGPLKGASE